MKIIKTYIAMLVENAESTLIKIHELQDGTYIKECNYLEIISEEEALKCKLNMINFIYNKKNKTS